MQNHLTHISTCQHWCADCFEFLWVHILSFFYILYSTLLINSVWRDLSVEVIVQGKLTPGPWKVSMPLDSVHYVCLLLIWNTFLPLGLSDNAVWEITFLTWLKMLRKPFQYYTEGIPSCLSFCNTYRVIMEWFTLMKSRVEN